MHGALAASPPLPGRNGGGGGKPRPTGGGSLSARAQRLCTPGPQPGRGRTPHLRPARAVGVSMANVHKLPTRAPEPPARTARTPLGGRRGPGDAPGAGAGRGLPASPEPRAQLQVPTSCAVQPGLRRRGAKRGGPGEAGPEPRLPLSLRGSRRVRRNAEAGGTAVGGDWVVVGGAWLAVGGECEARAEREARARPAGAGRGVAYLTAVSAVGESGLCSATLLSQRAGSLVLGVRGGSGCGPAQPWTGCLARPSPPPGPGWETALHVKLRQPEHVRRPRSISAPALDSPVELTKGV